MNRILLILAVLVTAAKAQPTFNLNTTLNNYPVNLPLACLGTGCDGSNRSLLGAGSELSEENTNPNCTAFPNHCAFNPGKGIKYCRITDNATDISGHSFGATTGEANLNSFSSDNKYFYIRETGGHILFFSMNPAAADPCTTVARYWATTSLATNAATFSRTQPGQLYYMSVVSSQAIINHSDLTNSTFNTNVVANLNTAPNCMNVVANGSYEDLDEVDYVVSGTTYQIFSVAVGTTGEAQDTISRVIVYDTGPGKGCRVAVVNSTTPSVVAANYGPTGPLADSTGNTTCSLIGIHETMLLKGGDWVLVSANGINGTGGCGQYPSGSIYTFWHIPTVGYYHGYAGDTDWAGHYTGGWYHTINKQNVSNPTYGNSITLFERYVTSPALATVGSSTVLNDNDYTAVNHTCTTQSGGFCPAWDGHPSWPWATSGTDIEPALDLTYNTWQVPADYGDNEIIIIPTNCYARNMGEGTPPLHGVTNPCYHMNPLIRVGHTYTDVTEGMIDYYGGYSLYNASTNPTNGVYFLNMGTNWQDQFGCVDGTSVACGVLQTLTIASGGTGYHSGDTGTISDGFGNGGTYSVSTVSGGVVTAVSLTAGGVSYLVCNGVPGGSGCADPGPGYPGHVPATTTATSGTGSGLTLKTTALVARSDAVMVMIPTGTTPSAPKLSVTYYLGML